MYTYVYIAYMHKKEQSSFSHTKKIQKTTNEFKILNKNRQSSNGFINEPILFSIRNPV